MPVRYAGNTTARTPETIFELFCSVLEAQKQSPGLAVHAGTTCGTARRPLVGAPPDRGESRSRVCALVLVLSNLTSNLAKLTYSSTTPA